MNLLAELNSDSLNPIYMSQIRYVCEKTGAKYYHSQILNSISSLEVLAELGDLSLLAAKLQYTVQEINETPQKLYDHFTNLNVKATVAGKLSHLEGIRYLYGHNIQLLFMKQYFQTQMKSYCL